MFIIYQTDVGVAVAPQTGGESAQQIADRLVPTGKKWRQVSSLPNDPQEQWRWTDAGPLEVNASQPDPVPQSVSRFQAKAALALAGLLEQANAVVAASGNVVLQLAWAEATEFKRNSPGINALAPALGLDDAALDQLFIAASGIVA